MTTYDRIAAIQAQLTDGLIGHDELVERLLIGLLTGGHLLIEGPPGVAKTRAVKRLAAAVQGSFARVQGTPDLLPSDVTGTPVFRPDRGVFEFAPGPVFHNILLVDEINRAPPKVQSALLEAMEERQVTRGTDTHALPDPFLVVATQNPIEQEGTFPLPEAQLDRFLLKVRLGLPDARTERAILDLIEGAPAPDGQVLTHDALRAAQAEVTGVHLSSPLRDRIVRLVMASRAADGVEFAISPRGSLALAAAVRARAWLAGRDHGLPEDVDTLAVDALAHRMRLSWAARSEGGTEAAFIRRVLEETPAL